MVDNNTGYGSNPEYKEADTNEAGALEAIDTGDLLDLDSQMMDQLIPMMFEIPLDHLHRLPDLEEIDSEYMFHIELNGETSGKSSWLYSNDLKKVFIKMSQAFHLNISYVPHGAHLFLRAMVVYSTKDDIHLPVVICHNHRHSRDQCRDAKQEMMPHVLRCMNPHTTYVGTEIGTTFNERLSVLIPLGESRQPQCNTGISLEFVCTNSCATGINRRTTCIILTLENMQRQILGKKLMHFKVCSCPKRDKDKEEALLNPEMPTKRKHESNHHPSRGKKPAKIVNFLPQIKKESSMSSPESPFDTNPTSPLNSLPGVAVKLIMPNVASMEYVLRAAFNEVAGQMTKIQKEEDHKIEPLLKNMRYIQKLIDDLNVSPSS